MVSPHGQGERGWASADILRTRGRGRFFGILCGCLYWMVSYKKRWKNLLCKRNDAV